MKLQEKAMLRALLARASGGEHLLPYLPSHLADDMQRWPAPSMLDFPKLLSQKEAFKPIHFSWFSNPIKSFPQNTQKLFLSLLDKKQASQVCQMLQIPYARVTFSPFMGPFLMDELKHKIYQGVEVVSVENLPHSTLNALISLTRNYLLNLIDLLGVHDLSTDLRQIVDKELIKKIYEALTENQLRFLHYSSRQPMKWISPKLGLNAWDGSKEKLQRLLHGRGLARLGHALSDENESLKWHVLHRLDIGRAAIVDRVMRQKQDLALIPYFKDQVIHIVKRYKT